MQWDVRLADLLHLSHPPRRHSVCSPLRPLLLHLESPSRDPPLLDSCRLFTGYPGIAWRVNVTGPSLQVYALHQSLHPAKVPEHTQQLRARLAIVLVGVPVASVVVAMTCFCSIVLLLPLSLPFRNALRNKFAGPANFKAHDQRPLSR